MTNTLWRGYAMCYRHRIKGITTIITPTDDDYDAYVSQLDDHYPCSATIRRSKRRILIIVGDRSDPDQVWSQLNDHGTGTCYLEWEKDDAHT